MKLSAYNWVIKKKANHSAPKSNEIKSVWVDQEWTHISLFALARIELACAQVLQKISTCTTCINVILCNHITWILNTNMCVNKFIWHTFHLRQPFSICAQKAEQSEMYLRKWELKLSVMMITHRFKFYIFTVNVSVAITISMQERA